MAWTGLTDQNLHNEIQYTLLETPNSGASYGSGLYTATEVQATLNLRFAEFAKRTGYLSKRSTAVSTTANTQTVSMPSDLIDLVRVGYPNSSGTITSIPRGSLVEAQAFITDLIGSDSAVDVPYMCSLDSNTQDYMKLSFYPWPNASRTLDFLYIALPTALPTTPNGTALNLPKDLCPFIKYGALADLFSKTGEAYDPARAQLCSQLFELGIQITQSFISGSAPLVKE